MPEATSRANARKSAVRARVEHVFAHQKNRFGLFVRIIGLARAEAKLTLANLVVLRPDFPPLVGRIRGLISGLMPPGFPASFSLQIRLA